MPRVTPRTDDAVDNSSATEAQIDVGGIGETLPPTDPSPAAIPTEWNDEFRGLGGSYVVVDGKRVPQD
jgi:hypothetical protein